MLWCQQAIALICSLAQLIIQRYTCPVEAAVAITQAGNMRDSSRVHCFPLLYSRVVSLLLTSVHAQVPLQAPVVVTPAGSPEHAHSAVHGDADRLHCPTGLCTHH
jgi:hypothetical protein